MRVKCISCGHELNLDHSIFDDYQGPVKCFYCSGMMEMKTVQGKVYSINPSGFLNNKKNSVLMEARG